MQTVYLAGPDVFLAEALDIGARKRALCEQYGFGARFPLDDAGSAPRDDAAETALAIFDACIAMMDACDLVVANLTPFRGVSMDVGTAVELGYMYAQGKPVFGYTNVIADYRTRLVQSGLSHDGEMVEDFGLVDNLMCEAVIRRSGSEVVRTEVPANRVSIDLTGFERCLALAQARDRSRQ